MLQKCRPYGTEVSTQMLPLRDCGTYIHDHFIDDLKDVPFETALLIVKNAHFSKIDTDGAVGNQTYLGLNEAKLGNLASEKVDVLVALS